MKGWRARARPRPLGSKVYPMASCGSNVAPIFLRLALGLTFLWAGWNKVFNTFPVQGERAAQLANLGVITPATPSLTPAPTTLPVPDLKPSHPKPDSKPDAKPEPKPEVKPADSVPASTPPATEPTAPSKEPSDPPPARELAPTTPVTIPSELVNTEPNSQVVQVNLNLAPITYTASDFPEPQQVRFLYSILFKVTDAAAPKPDDAGKTPMPLLPAAVNQGRWPVYIAWTVALTELIGGAFLLVGFLGRFAGFLSAGVMAGALWLTQIGPAIQDGTAKLGFLPNHGFWEKDAAENFVYATPMWQLMLLCACLAVMVLGSGALSIDALFARPHSPVTKDEA